MDGEIRKVVNVVLACKDCNRLKSHFTLDEFETHVRTLLAGKTVNPIWNTVLCSIIEAKQQQLEEHHAECLTIAKDYQTESIKTRKIRKKAAMKRRKDERRRKEREILDIIRSHQSVSTPEVGVYPQIEEKRAPEPCNEVVEASKPPPSGLFWRIKAFINKLP